MSYVHLETLKSLDRETTSSYLLNISATASEQTQQLNGVYRGTLSFKILIIIFKHSVKLAQHNVGENVF